jgi:nitronate monooxygenase
MLVSSTADDVVLTDAVTGIPANMLRQSLENAGFQKGQKPEGFNLLKEIEVLKAWRDIWSAGHGVGDVTGVEGVADLVGRLSREYELARSGTRAAAA